MKPASAGFFRGEWGTASGGQFDWGGTPLTKEIDNAAGVVCPLKSEVPKDLLIQVRNLKKSVRAKGGLIGRLTTRRPNAKAWSSDLPCLINSVGLSHESLSVIMGAGPVRKATMGIIG